MTKRKQTSKSILRSCFRVQNSLSSPKNEISFWYWHLRAIQSYDPLALSRDFMSLYWKYQHLSGFKIQTTIHSKQAEK